MRPVLVSVSLTMTSSPTGTRAGVERATSHAESLCRDMDEDATGPRIAAARTKSHPAWAVMPVITSKQPTKVKTKARLVGRLT